MAGFGLGKKYGPRLQKNGGCLLTVQFSSVVHFRKR